MEHLKFNINSKLEKNELLDLPMLLVFDMDSTIIETNTDDNVIEYLNTQLKRKITDIDYSRDWTIIMTEIYKSFKELNLSISDIKRIVEDISLNDGFKEVFDYISNNKNNFESIIISGSNTLFVDWVLRKNGLHQIFSKIFSNKARISEDNLLCIEPYHNHNCRECNACQCKRIILTEFLSERSKLNRQYSNIVFVGDGENDLCPGKIFSVNDYICGRENYHLDNHIRSLKKQNVFNYKFNYLSWKSGFDVLRLIRKLCRK